MDKKKGERGTEGKRDGEEKRRLSDDKFIIKMSIAMAIYLTFCP